MQSNNLALLRSIALYKCMRIRALEAEYEEKEKDEENEARIIELGNKLTVRLSVNAKTMLTEYVDRLVAKYNTDGSYFYNKGFNDSRHIYSSLSVHTKRS